MECLCYIKFWYLCFTQKRPVDRINDQRTSYGAEDKCFSLQQIHVLTAITFLVRKIWTHTPNASRSYSSLAARRNTGGFQNLQNPLQANVVGFLLYAMLLIVLEIHFSWLFSNKAYFRVCCKVCKIRLPFFMLIPTSKYQHT